MPDAPPSRDDLLSQYLDALPYDPYPVQEEALLAWFTHPQGVLVCAPTGTGKTLIAEAALFEALHTGKTAYYTTPLIALTEQKFQEIRDAAVRWGFSADDVGLVTGNRAVNPRAKVLVVVAEILLNRLLHREAFDFADVAAVVMDEFHSFADPERGIVWELSLSLLPAHVRLLLLSATVGNAPEFVAWLHGAHGRTIQLVRTEERKVPLTYHWVGDELLTDQIESMTQGDDDSRLVPTLLFCFNRDECWSVAETLKGKHLVSSARQKELAAILEEYSLDTAAGRKLKPILLRGVGVHHAGILPKYKRIVEEIFIRKLLSVVVCTETLAAGMNLPARSVVLTTLLKGPPGRKKLIDASSAHQMFGRAGRPQFDDKGHVVALAHDDDVKIARWHQKNNLEELENSPDPKVRATIKRLKKKMPKRRSNFQYWGEEQFNQLIEAPPGKLSSRGQLPWRLLAHLLKISPDVEPLREVVRKRLLPPGGVEGGQKNLTRMLLSLDAGGFVKLEPAPPKPKEKGETKNDGNSSSQQPEAEPDQGLLGSLIEDAREDAGLIEVSEADNKIASEENDSGDGQVLSHYEPRLAVPTEKMQELLAFRSVNPLYGSFLLRLLGKADREETLQILESLLEVPGSTQRQVRVPQPDRLEPGPLATQYVDQEVLARGLLSAEELYPDRSDEAVRELHQFAPPIGEKVQLLFRHEFPNVRDVRVRAVRIAADLLEFGGDFNSYVSGRDLARQEGVIFRHLLRLILLCGEFRAVCPDGRDPAEWSEELLEIENALTESCRAVDTQSTDVMLEQSQHDPLDGEPEPSEADDANGSLGDHTPFGDGLAID
ncbi:DEAD/DEAH box helicase [Stratiformator vulcanicus]|uniref:Transcription-repair-coupling factor n=1 Tax=Stratiformator vulcanicus TaxID=2527980 RepID=A0A517R1A2_9PLAN|nr:DEAD/DEAH box helicase [Stratiformator vulcanicus]QDT37620.1 Transcription-repair-coupling factor [Stratiformator vulcanicus]